MIKQDDYTNNQLLSRQSEILHYRKHNAPNKANTSKTDEKLKLRGSLQTIFSGLHLHILEYMQVYGGAISHMYNILMSYSLKQVCMKLVYLYNFSRIQLTTFENLAHFHICTNNIHFIIVVLMMCLGNFSCFENVTMETL